MSLTLVIPCHSLFFPVADLHNKLRRHLSDAGLSTDTEGVFTSSTEAKARKKRR